MADVVLVHGAATTPLVWSAVLDELDGLDVVAPQRPITGDLAAETDWLAGLAPDAVVVGMSGGATLVLELAARGVPARALIAHEPAAGRLAPGFFAPLDAALERGVDDFARTLYGPGWERDPLLGADAVPRDVAMFRSFEPAAPLTPALVTTGERSPELRHRIAALLAETLGYDTASVPGSGHLVARDAPTAIAAMVRAALR